MNFNITHELFHLITWSEKAVDKVSINKELHEHNEKITDAFVAALAQKFEASKDANVAIDVFCIQPCKKSIL